MTCPTPLPSDPFFTEFYDYPTLKKIHDAGPQHHRRMGDLRERDRVRRKHRKPPELPVETSGSWLSGCRMEREFTTTEGS